MVILKLPSKRRVLKWSNDDVLNWLKKVGLDDCLEAFAKRALNGTQLLELGEEMVITFSDIKINQRRQIVKCINECKAQASNAKKLVKTIKDKNKGVDNNDPDDDDDVGWGSDFDDDDESDDNDDDVLNNDELHISQSSGGGVCAKYDLQSAEERGFEPVHDYMGNVHVTGFKLLTEEIESSFKDMNLNGNSNTHFNRDVRELDIQQKSNSSVNGTKNSPIRSNDMSLKNSEIRDPDTGVNITSVNDSRGSSPKPSARVMPKPPNSKPQVPKNKPPIIPRKPLNNGSRVSNSTIKRPPSEPPPPPLPKSPPPVSPHHTPAELQTVFDDSLISNGNKYDTYESPNIAEDEYLPPIRADTPKNLDRKQSLSTLSSLSSTRDCDSLNGGSSSPLSLASSATSSGLSSGLSPHPEYDYEPFGTSDCTAEVNGSFNDQSEDTYEIVRDDTSETIQPFNKVLPVIQRPLLPKVKDSSNTASAVKTKIKSDVFPALPNWTRIAKEKKLKEKQENELTNGDSNCSSPSFDVINNNSHSFTQHQHQFLQCPSVSMSQHSLRPLPPLPRPQHGIGHGNESLRNFSWYHNVEREDAEALLMSQDEDGAYLVRESKRAGKSNPYTLTIFHDGRVFHLNIRKRPDGLYALGKEKPREKTFKTVADLVSYHHSEPILLTTRGTPAGKTRLIISPPH